MNLNDRMKICCHQRRQQFACAVFSCAAVISFCWSSTRAQTKEAYKFEELLAGAGSCESAWTDLDFFALELRKNPTVKGYIIFYGGKAYDFYKKPKSRLPRRNEAEFRATIADVRLKWLGVDSSRYVIVNGGYRDKFTFEFWIVPAGAEVPKSTPTVANNQITFRKGTPAGDLWGCVF